MMRNIGIVVLAIALSGCSIFGGKKTRLVPQAYMPEPPAILMQAPKELHTIKQKSNITVTDTHIIVDSPKKD